MVRELRKEDQTFYQCEACGFGYKDSQIAQNCEDYCNKHNSCSIEFTKHAVLK